MSKEKVKSPKASASPRGSTDGDDSKASKPPYKTDSRGDDFMAQAQKKLNKSSLLGFMSSSNKVTHSHSLSHSSPVPSRSPNSRLTPALLRSVVR